MYTPHEFPELRQKSQRVGLCYVFYPGKYPTCLFIVENMKADVFDGSSLFADHIMLFFPLVMVWLSKCFCLVRTTLTLVKSGTCVIARLLHLHMTPQSLTLRLNMN